MLRFNQQGLGNILRLRVRLFGTRTLAASQCNYYYYSPIIVVVR